MQNLFLMCHLFCLVQGFLQLIGDIEPNGKIIFYRVVCLHNCCREIYFILKYIYNMLLFCLIIWSYWYALVKAQMCLRKAIVSTQFASNLLSDFVFHGGVKLLQLSSRLLWHSLGFRLVSLIPTFWHPICIVFWINFFSS